MVSCLRRLATVYLALSLGAFGNVALSGASITGKDSDHNEVAFPGVPESTSQLLVALAETWNSSDGILLRFVRADAEAPWQQFGEEIPVLFGKQGLAWGRGLWQIPESRTAIQPVKKEGDLRSPAGLFHIGPLYAENRPTGSKLDWVQTNDLMYCEDNPDSAQYNLPIDLNPADQKACRDNPNECPTELLVRPDGIYNKLLWIHHNASPVMKGAGSCIFLHINHTVPRPTAGCTAVFNSAMDKLVTWLDPAAHPLLLQIPREELSGLVDLPYPFNE